MVFRIIGEIISIGIVLNTGTTLEIRKDWREKLGMDTIDTLDEFEKYLYAVRDADFDGNGIEFTTNILGNYHAAGKNRQKGVAGKITFTAEDPGQYGNAANHRYRNMPGDIAAIDQEKPAQQNT